MMSDDARVTIRVELPFHLRTLAGVAAEAKLEMNALPTPTQRSIVDALESKYPMLRGTIRDHQTLQRRPFLRFFACGRDLTHDSPDSPLPLPVATGAEPLLIVGAIAGG